MASRLSTERWSIELPDGWSSNRSGERYRLIPPSSTARIVVSELRPDLATLTNELVQGPVRAVLDAANATVDRVEEPPISTDDGRLVVVGAGRGERGYCGAAAHAWPGTLVLLSFVQVDESAEVREQASAILRAVRRTDAAHTAPARKSIVDRLLRR
jgi:hypothetical protein